MINRVAASPVNGATRSLRSTAPRNRWVIEAPPATGSPTVDRAGRPRAAGTIRHRRTLDGAGERAGAGLNSPGRRSPGKPISQSFCTRLQDGAGGNRLTAARIALRVGPAARPAQIQKSRPSRRETGGGGGLGSETITAGQALSAPSHRRSGSRSPPLARSMMALAIASRGGSSSPQLRRAWMAVSKARPMRRVVSASNR
jgi:hypothetical protein